MNKNEKYAKGGTKRIIDSSRKEEDLERGNGRRKEIKVTSLPWSKAAATGAILDPFGTPFNGAGLVRSSSVGTKWHDDDDDATA